MNVGPDADQNDVLDAIWSAFWPTCGRREEDPLRVMWRAYLDGKSDAQSGEKSSSGVGEHIYIGQYADDQTSLDYLNARYYDGSRGQFLSEDPVFLGNPSSQNLVDPQSLNTYSYSVDNPITKSDPTGKMAGWDDFIASSVGGIVGFDAYTIESAITHQPMTPGGALGAVLSGAYLAEGIENAPGTGGTSIEVSLVTKRSEGRCSCRCHQ
jgi:RHS repeat-associated protein